MYLEKITIINLKSCKNISVDFRKDDPNIFIGPNDSGKSVILESIGCLLENKKLDFESDGKITSDVSNTPVSKKVFDRILENLKLPEFNYDSQCIYILGIFKCEENDSAEFFDKNASNHLKWSRESFSKESIIILKKFSADNVSGLPYLCSLESMDKSRGEKLWWQNKTYLNNIAKNLEIGKDDIENENNSGPFKNIELLRAIYSKNETAYVWSEYLDYAKDIKALFPLYRYFDSKISMDDIKGTAKDILSQKINPFRERLLTNIKEVSNDASREANVELESLSEILFKELDGVKCIKMGVNFSIQENISDVIIEKNLCDGDIKLDSQGDGIKKQIWLSFIKWKSLQSIDENEKSKKIIWCFDEPEIHLFPKAQRDLFSNIKNISKGVIQSFICTHSTIFIDKFDINSIKQVSLFDGYSILSKCGGVSDIHTSLGIKNSDILFYDKFFVIEGFTEFFLLPYFYKLYFNKDLIDDNIQIINLRGKDNRINNANIFSQILKDFKKQEDLVCYFFDGDSAIENCDNVCIIGKCDIEDSISNKIWKKLVKNYCDYDVSDKDLDKLRGEINLADSNKKFHKLLSSFLISNGCEKILPRKGESLANELKNIIVEKNDIPSEIINFFEKI